MPNFTVLFNCLYNFQHRSLCSSGGLLTVCVFVCRWMVACIHGDKSQQERDIVLRGEKRLW